MTGSRSRTGQGGAEPVHPYLALIGDVVGSRELEDRAGVQRRLRGLLEALNRELGAPGEGEDPLQGAADADGARRGKREGPPLAAPLAVTAGDEIQGLLLRPDAAVDVLVRLADGLHPVRIAWGLGAGKLETDLHGDVSLLDGPCFHRAREALERATKDGAWARAVGLDPAVDRGLSALFRLVGAVREGWTETQARYARAVRGRLQKEVAERFDVSPSVVSESLKAARFRELVEAEAAARALLARFGAGGEPAPDSAPAPNAERELNPAPDLPEYLA